MYDPFVLNVFTPFKLATITSFENTLIVAPVKVIGCVVAVTSLE